MRIDASPSRKDIDAALATITARITSFPTQSGVYRPGAGIGDDADRDQQVAFAAQTTLQSLLLQQPDDPHICPLCGSTYVSRLASGKGKASGRISKTISGPNAGAITEGSHWCQESKDAPYQLFLTLAAAVPISTAPADPEHTAKAAASALASKQRLASIKLLFSSQRSESPDLSEQAPTEIVVVAPTAKAATAPGDTTENPASPSGYNLRRTNSGPAPSP